MLKYLFKFSPVLVVWPIWLCIVISQNLWHDIFTDYWPLTIGMIVGSFIGGATPLGGGVIVYPIAVLLLQLNTTESRDASILVQSVGMCAASFLLITSKSHLLHPTLIYVNIIFGCVGMLIANGINQSANVINLIYTVTLLCFGVIYFYTNYSIKSMAHQTDMAIQPTHMMTLEDMLNMRFTTRDYIAHSIMAVFAIIGGIMTFYIGTGSDIMTFVFGVYVWNTIYPDRQYKDSVFIASTVVVMGAMCTLTSIARAFGENGFSRQVLLCFGADSFVAVIGAPLGAMILTPRNEKYLQYLFYVLTVAQFVLFGTLAITDDLMVWIIVCITVGVLIGLLILHYYVTKRNRTASLLLLKQSNNAKRAGNASEIDSFLKRGDHSNRSHKFIYIENS